MPWYSTAKLYLLKAWAWCKKYWQFLAGIAVPLLIGFLLRRRDSGQEQMKEVVNRIQSDHAAELEAIDQSHQIEQEAVQAAQVRRDETVKEVEAAYEDARIELDEKKKKEVKRLARRYANNPDELTRQLSRATGISVWTGKRN